MRIPSEVGGKVAVMADDRLRSALVALAALKPLCLPRQLPATGDDTIAGGIFCISLPDLAAYLAKVGNNPGAGGSETPRAPAKPPPARAPTATSSPPTGPRRLRRGQSKVSDMRDSLDWAFDGGAATYGDIDLEKVATAGHSCGGLESMSTAYHDERVKRIILFNIAIFQDERRYLLEEINVPVAWMVGGESDMGYPNAEKDYALLPEGLSAYKANLDTGHGGTHQATNGGKFGKAAVAYLQWQFRDDEASKAICLDPEAEGSLVSDNWEVEFKNWS
ncbi:unnamed protein product [Parascedosporium putredinis]|uniref:Uncharacterized protein n=1 Tax=Parascedosporium putredinis TaxID=1442378 RepID=A0A9P1HC25_9PEZI|nr:unnamed protein product [Parascedosporium putredinis]CAI8003935.1 unnamed protein product [Parascedosporium putredinis]